MRKWTLTLGLLLAVLPWATSRSAQPADAGSSGFRDRSIFQDVADVHVVNVDVVVTDREGNPIPGLTADDFELYENGERVDVDHFYAIQGGSTAALDGTVTGRDVPGRVTLPVEEPKEIVDRQPLYLAVYVDNVQLQKPHRDRALTRLREVLENRSVGENTRVMLVSNDRGVTIRHGFTCDRRAVSKALDGLEEEPTYDFLIQQELRTMLEQLQDLNADAGNMAIGDLRFGGFGTAEPSIGPPQGDADGGPDGVDTGERYGVDGNRGDPGFMQRGIADQAQHLVPQMIAFAQKRQNQIRGTVEVLRNFIDHMAGLPGRKVVLYVSGGLSLNPAEALFQTFESRVSGMAAGMGNQGVLGREIERFDLSRSLTGLVQHANASGVTFYAVDASPPSSLSRGSAASAGGGTGAVTARFDSRVDAIEERNQHESLQLVTEGTGGRAALSSANLEKALESFFVDFENFYSLGYEAERTPPERIREIEVRLTREARQRFDHGVELRYRNVIRDKSVSEKMVERTLSALVMDVHENPLEVELAMREQTPAEDGKYTVPAIVRVPLGKLVLLPGERQHEARVNIYLAVLDEKGRTSPVARQLCPIRVPNEELLVALGQSAGCGVRLLMRKGRQRVAVSVRDELAAVSSTVFVDVEVPGEPETASADLAEGAAKR